MSTARVHGTVTYADRDIPDGFPSGSCSWTVELRYRGRRMTTPFFTGPALGEPDVADVMSLLVERCTVEDASTFEDFCAEMGYDTDPLGAEQTYRAVQAGAKKVREFLGEDYRDALNDPETWAKTHTDGPE